MVAGPVTAQAQSSSADDSATEEIRPTTRLPRVQSATTDEGVVSHPRPEAGVVGAGPDASVGSEHPRVAFGIDFLPHLGTSSGTGGREIRGFSLNLLAGRCFGLDGGEIGFGLNLESGFVDGAQLAGLGNFVAGPVSGVQGAGLVNLAGDARDAVQIGGALNYANVSVDTVQVTGGLNLLGGPLDGVQVAGAVNFAAGITEGIQVAGGVNVATDRFLGLQIAGLGNLAAGSLQGAQIGLVNIAAGDVNGIQIGLINVAARAKMALGAINVLYRGRVEGEVWATETGHLIVGLKHGDGPYHYLYGVGIRPFAESGRYAPGMGLGARLYAAGRVHVDLDHFSQVHVDDLAAPARPSLSTMLRLVIGYSIFDQVALIGGLSYNLLVAEDADGAGYPLIGGAVLHRDGDRTVRAWPGFLLGLHVLSEPVGTRGR